MRKNAFPILMYHSIADMPRGTIMRSLHVQTNRFNFQMRLLKIFGYRGVSMTELKPYLTGEKSGKVIGLTFDDGYNNNYSIINNEGGGDCLFSAIRDGLARVNKKYTVKEIFYTLQGEGYNAGKAAIFCRFTGCNLWNGKEKDRKKSICSFCDTDFLGTDGALGGQYSLENLVNKITKLWPQYKKNKFVVFTGGEPLLQLDQLLIDRLKNNNFKVAVETNGTILPPLRIDWICVSPKVKSNFILKV